MMIQIALVTQTAVIMGHVTDKHPRVNAQAATVAGYVNIRQVSVWF